MKRGLATLAVLAAGIILGGVVSQVSPTAKIPFAWMTLPMAAAPPADAGVKGLSAPPGKAEAKPEGFIEMPPEIIEAQGIAIAPAGKGTLARVVDVPGTISLDPGRVARVAGRVEGTVIQMRKRLGDTVSPGEVVAILDSREVADAKSEYLTAQVALDLQRTLFERQQILWAQKSTAEQQYLQARENFLEAELKLNLSRQKLVALNLDPAQVEAAAKQESAPGFSASSLREYSIRSLIGGRVVERKVDVGTLVGRQGDPSDLYTVADLSVIWAELAVPTADLETIEEGQSVVITSGKDSGKRGEGRIIFISPLIDPSTRSARVVAKFDNKAMIWRPGAAVTASIAIEQRPVDIRVPRSAVQTVDGERVVFVRTGNGFQKRIITTGRSDEQYAEVTSGLSAGEQIAVTNTFLLKAELGKGSAEGD